MSIWANRITGYGEEAPDQLLAHPLNARLHPKAQQDALRGVLREVGVVQNIIVNQRTQTLLDGHLRVSLALRDGQPTIPVTYVDVSEAEEAVILATLDPISAAAAYDRDKLDALLREVTTGDDAVQALLANLAEDNGVLMGLPEAGEEAPVQIDEVGPTRVQPGEVWRVGEHIIACLDSTDRVNVERLVAGRKVEMVWADPPYGIDVKISDGKHHGRAIARRNKFDRVVGDKTTDTVYTAVALFSSFDVVQIWWGANYYADALPPSSCWIVWDKETGANDFADAEVAWVNDDSAIRIFRHRWSGLMKDSERGERRVHPTQKPIALCAWAFEKYGASGDLIVDPFLGSGPSIKAAHQMGNRTVIGFELSPHYCDHILEWGEAHGLTAERINL